MDRSASTIVELLNRDPDPTRAAEVLAQRFKIPLDRAVADVESVISAVQNMSARRVARSRRPTAVGLTAVLRSWGRLSWPNRIRTARASLAVVIIELGLLRVDVSTLARWVGAPLMMDDRPLPPTDSDAVAHLTRREQDMYWAVQWVLARWLFDATCLRGALALGWFLRHRRPLLRLGLIDDRAVVAHAWIEVDGRAFNAQPMIAALSSGRAGSLSGEETDPRDGIL